MLIYNIKSYNDVLLSRYVEQKDDPPMPTIIRSASSDPTIATVLRLQREGREQAATLPDTTTEQGQREASVMLARLCGWLTKDNAFYNYSPPNGKGASANHKKGYSAVDIFRPIPNGASCPTLYHPDNMALALRCIRWGMENSAEFDEFVGTDAYRILRLETGINDALDEILKLSIEAGLVAAANESQ